MKIQFGPHTLACICTSLIVSICTFIGYNLAGCASSAQIDKAQSTLTKIEAATTQASDVAGAVTVVTPPPVASIASEVQLLLLLALAGEKAFGTYILPLFQKKSGASPSTSTSVTATGNATTPNPLKVP